MEERRGESGCRPRGCAGSDGETGILRDTDGEEGGKSGLDREGRKVGKGMRFRKSWR